MGVLKNEFVRLWQCRVQQQRLLLSGEKPVQTGNPFTSYHVWSLPLLMVTWSAVMACVMLLALYLRTVMNLGECGV